MRHPRQRNTTTTIKTLARGVWVQALPLISPIIRQLDQQHNIGDRVVRSPPNHLHMVPCSVKEGGGGANMALFALTRVDDES
jgi:hypothetical protein